MKKQEEARGNELDTIVQNIVNRLEGADMNLKFQKVDWENDLMYVELEADDQTFRWRPKWKDVDTVLHCAWLTEGKKSWHQYFEIMVSEILIRNLVRRIVSAPSPTLPKLDVMACKLFSELRKLNQPEAHYASP